MGPQNGEKNLYESTLNNKVTNKKIAWNIMSKKLKLIYTENLLGIWLGWWSL